MLAFRSRLSLNKKEDITWRVNDELPYYHKWLWLLKPGDRFYAVKNKNCYLLEVLEIPQNTVGKKDKFPNQLYKCKVKVVTIEQKKVSDSITEKLSANVHKRYKYKCNLCGIDLSKDQMNVDHIKPWVEFGETVIDNLQSVCRTCNQLKRRRDENALIKRLLLRDGP